MSIDTGSQVWGARLVGSEDWVTYTLAEKAGGGGAASIFKLGVKSKPPLVAKIYNEESVERLRSDPRYAARMILLASERAELGEALPFVVWPRRALFDTRPPPGKAQRHIIGYTMEYLPGTCPTSTPMRQFERLEERRISGSS